jgi:hypothetical protein
MTDKRMLWLLFKDMTTTEIQRYNLAHRLVGSEQLTRQQIDSWRY